MLELSDELRLIFAIRQEDARCRHIQILILPRAALNSVSHTRHQTVVTILRNIPLHVHVGSSGLPGEKNLLW